MDLPLTEKYQQDENRRKALERLKQRGVVSGTTVNRVTKASIPSNERGNLSTIKLTDEQRKKIEENRQRALAKLKEKQDNFRNASNSANPSLDDSKKRAYKPSVVTSEYIEYDLTTMKDTKGGFIDMAQPGGDGVGKSFDDWKEEQRIVRDLPPPVDMQNATKCYECKTYEIDQQLWEVFRCRVCKRCAKAHPEKYSLLTKTECREDYFLTESELEDHALLRRMFKPNPHSKFNRMQLYLRYQVEEFSFNKWGGADGLDKEWQRREEGKVKRRDRKYELKMKEMRKKTRAEEYNRRLREGKFDGKHVHEWSGLFGSGKDDDGLDVVKRRCLQCGFEVEETVL